VDAPAILHALQTANVKRTLEHFVFSEEQQMADEPFEKNDCDVTKENTSLPNDADVNREDDVQIETLQSSEKTEKSSRDFENSPESQSISTTEGPLNEVTDGQKREFNTVNKSEDDPLVNKESQKQQARPDFGDELQNEEQETSEHGTDHPNVLLLQSAELGNDSETKEDDTEDNVTKAEENAPANSGGGQETPPDLCENELAADDNHSAQDREEDRPLNDPPPSTERLAPEENSKSSAVADSLNQSQLQPDASHENSNSNNNNNNNNNSGAYDQAESGQSVGYMTFSVI